MATMSYCPQCGAAIQHGAAFCVTCGHRFEGVATPRSDSSVGGGGQAIEAELRYVISLRRILFMSIVSYGLYFFYWFFLTWKHYRDHTTEEVYPVWHATTQIVPIYSLFRVHAHMRAFVEVMGANRLETTISPGWAVAAVLVFGGMFSATAILEEGEITQGIALLVAVVDAMAIGIVALLLLRVQTNLNSYWAHSSGGKPLSARVGAGEVIIAVIGGLAWFDTLANLFSASYRGGL